MTRILLVCCVLALGCHRGQKANAPEPPNERPGGGPNENLTGQQRVQQSKILTAPGRAVWLNELDELRKFITQYQAENGRYPTKLDDMPDLSRDLPRTAQAIRDGELLLAGGKGGILAYPKDALTAGGRVITTSGVQEMAPDDLRRALGS
jgi:hypothetical protein